MQAASAFPVSPTSSPEWEFCCPLSLLFLLNFDSTSYSWCPLWEPSHNGFLAPGLPGSTSGKEPACQCRRLKDTGLIPVLGRSPGEAHGNPLQYSCLENPKDREPWMAVVQGVAKSWTQLKLLSTQCENSKTFMPYLRLRFIPCGVGRVPLLLSSRSWPGSPTAQVPDSAVGRLVPARHGRLGKARRLPRAVLSGEERSACSRHSCTEGAQASQASALAFFHVPHAHRDAGQGHGCGPPTCILWSQGNTLSSSLVNTAHGFWF